MLFPNVLSVCFLPQYRQTLRRSRYAAPPAGLTDRSRPQQTPQEAGRAAVTSDRVTRRDGQRSLSCPGKRCHTRFSLSYGSCIALPAVFRRRPVRNAGGKARRMDEARSSSPSVRCAQMRSCRAGQDHSVRCPARQGHDPYRPTLRYARQRHSVLFSPTARPADTVT